MSDKHMTLRRKALRRLQALTEDLHLDSPRIEDHDHVLATAIARGLGPAEKNRELVISTRKGTETTIGCRNVLQIGTGTARSNRTATYLLGELFLPSDEVLTPQQINIMAMMVDQHGQGRSTVDDLLAHVVCGSNDLTRTTRAYVDFRDGEVIVDLTAANAENELPDNFDIMTRNVLVHAHQLIQVARLVRNVLTDNSDHMATTIAELRHQVDALLRERQNDESDNGQDPALEEKPDKQPALML